MRLAMGLAGLFWLACSTAHWLSGSLPGTFPVSRPAISQHLRLLKQANLVIDKPAGTRRVYQLHPEGFNSLREYFDQFWGRALDSFKNKVEEGS